MVRVVGASSQLMKKSPFAVASLCAVLFTGCLARGGRPLLISSVESDYSPVVTFNAKVTVSDSVRVSVDRVRILYPGEVIPGVGPVTGPIEMQALVVAANPAADPSKGEATVDRNGTRKPWIERATGQSVRLSEGLVMGEAQNAGPFEFTIPVSTAVDLPKNWLVFRITGPAVAMSVRMADGSVMESSDKMPSIRVFACATQNLDGRKDKARSAVFRKYYSEGC